jgi:hypothetical protein
MASMIAEDERPGEVNANVNFFEPASGVELAAADCDGWADDAGVAVGAGAGVDAAVHAAETHKAEASSAPSRRPGFPLNIRVLLS